MLHMFLAVTHMFRDVTHMFRVSVGSVKPGAVKMLPSASVLPSEYKKNEIID